MEDKNFVLDFNWEKDIQEAPIPSHFVNLYNTAQNAHAGFSRVWPMGSYNDVYPLVQADPNDMLRFSHSVAGSYQHHVNKMIWQNTIDKYLYQYYVLVKRQTAGESRPYEISEPLYYKLWNYFSAADTRRKTIPPHFQLSKPATTAKKKPRDRTYYIPKFAGAAQLNWICRWLYSKADASVKPNSVYYDGLVIRVNDKVSAEKETVSIIPNFELVDYIQHELFSGISLSIEIASVLLEITDKDIRKKALESFINDDKTLSMVVSSPLIFTRISAARNYFQQIILEHQTQYYQWNSTNKTANISDSVWQGTITRASMHLEVLKPKANWVDVPENAVDDALEQITSLLAMVKIPENLIDYVKNPQYGLAAFCHREHPNVSYFLDELKEKNKAKITSIPECNTDEHRVFMNVHAAIRNAIWDNKHDSMV